MSEGNIHKTAKEGFTQGDHYDKSRPSYSDSLFHMLSVIFTRETTKGDKDFVLNHFTSISVIARLDPPRKEEAMRKLRAVLDETFTDDEEITIPFKSDFYCTEKV